MQNKIQFLKIKTWRDKFISMAKYIKNQVIYRAHKNNNHMIHLYYQTEYINMKQENLCEKAEVARCSSKQLTWAKKKIFPIKAAGFNYTKKKNKHMFNLRKWDFYCILGQCQWIWISNIFQIVLDRRVWFRLKSNV